MVAIELRVVRRAIGARHAVAAETDYRHREISVAEFAVFHNQPSCLRHYISQTFAGQNAL